MTNGSRRTFKKRLIRDVGCLIELITGLMPNFFLCNLGSGLKVPSFGSFSISDLKRRLEFECLFCPRIQKAFPVY